MAIRCCQHYPQEEYHKLFCSINDALNACVEQYPNVPLDNLIFNLVIESKVYYRRSDGQIAFNYNKTTIDGITEILKKYRRCKESKDPPPADNELWNPSQSCEFGRPKENQPSGACRAWARSVNDMFFRIWNAIDSIRQEACDIAQEDAGGDPMVGQLLNLPDPEFQITTICAPKNLRTRPPQRKDHEFNPLGANPQQGN